MKAELSEKTAIFDLDMTLVEYTFAPAVFKFADKLAEMTGSEIDKEEFHKEWRQIFEDFRPLMVVNPIVTTITAQILMERHGIELTSNEGKRMLYDLNKAIYNTPSEDMKLCPGAIEAVEMTQENCKNSLIGTIGRGGWTKRVKLPRTGLSEYFPDENVFCFNVNAPKSGQWVEMLGHYNLTPDDVFVVGDDLHADILPMIGIGVLTAFWVNNGKMNEAEFWATAVPDGVIKISTTGELAKYFQG